MINHGLRAKVGGCGYDDVLGLHFSIGRKNKGRYLCISLGFVVDLTQYPGCGSGRVATGQGKVREIQGQ